MKYFKSHTKIKKSILSNAIFERELGEFTYWGGKPVLKLDDDDLFDLNDLYDVVYSAEHPISLQWDGVRYPVSYMPLKHDIFYVNLINRRVYTTWHAVKSAPEDIAKAINEEMKK